MTEKQLRELYIKAMIDVVGSMPLSVIERPVSPLLQRFAQLVAEETRKNSNKEQVC